MLIKIALPLLLVWTPFSLAQEAAPAAPPAAAPAPAASDPKVVMLRSQLMVRQQRVTALVNQIIELDSGIEKAITNVQTMLKGITDSKDSKAKVSHIKQDVMKRLQKAAEYYDQKRSAASAELQSSKNQIDRADLFKDRSMFDDRINKRIDGIIELALSMDSHEDYEKYLYSGGGGWDAPNIRRNPDYDHNRKVARQTDNAKSEIEKVLDTSVDRLDVQERNLKQKIAAATGEEKDRLEKELERVSALKLERYDQTEDLRIARETKGRPVSLKEANRMEDIIEEVAADARRDLQSLFARYSELKVERSALARIQASLESLEAGGASKP